VLIFQAIIVLMQLVVSIWMALIYKRQTELMSGQRETARQQVALARNEFIASHRPLLVIHSLRVLPRNEGEPLKVQFAVVNAGTGRCDVTGSAVYLGYLHETSRLYLPDLPRTDVISCRPYEVGATDNSIIVEADQDGWIDHDVIRAEVEFTNGYGNPAAEPEREQKIILHLGGWVAYREASGNTRTTYFHRIYDHATERFAASGDPDDEKTY
jgi:hypothetical protein